MAEEKCIFCNYDSIKEDILWESDNFFVKVGVGILAPGHVMIISKKHLSCLGELPKQLTEEFIFLKDDVFDKIKSNFSEPIVYEHGVYSQSIKHAHLHFVPSKNSFYKLENIGNKIFKDLESSQINDFFKLMMFLKEMDPIFI
jgi:diadenosine tetraphosphate (Ap4A) HIT family hydrolase